MSQHRKTSCAPRDFLSSLFLALLLAAGSAHAQAVAEPASQPVAQPASSPIVEFTTLRLMRDKGLITDDEYQSALHALGDSVGAQAGQSLTVVFGRWATTMYGFVEADFMGDSTQSFNDLAGNGQVARPASYQGKNSRFTTGLRNSRIGFRLQAPEFHRISTSGTLEMDFLGNQSPIGSTQAFQISENAFFTNPSFRIRHFNLRVSTPYVDVLIGQSWHLFGWQPLFQPNTVEIQGVLGEIYSRTPQLRLSKATDLGPVTIEVAVALMRPPQRDSGVPEGQAGVRFAVDKWRGTQTIGSAGGNILAPAGIAFTGDIRDFRLPQFAAQPQTSVHKLGWGLAADAFLPILPATEQDHGNSLSLNGEYSWGVGTADLYTNLSGGVGNAPLPNPNNTSPAPTFTPNVDPNLAVYNSAGVVGLIQWQSYLAGVQYYLPRLDGRLWVSSNYSHIGSNNAYLFAAPGAIARKSADRVDANVFGDIMPGLRLGLGYVFMIDHYADGINARNHRVQLSAFFIF